MHVKKGCSTELQTLHMLRRFGLKRNDYWRSLACTNTIRSEQCERMIDKQAAHCKSLWAAWWRAPRRFVALDFWHDRLPAIVHGFVHLNIVKRGRERGRKGETMGGAAGWNLCRYRCSEKQATSAAADAVDDDALNNCRRGCIAPANPLNCVYTLQTSTDYNQTSFVYVSKRHALSVYAHFLLIA